MLSSDLLVKYSCLPSDVFPVSLVSQAFQDGFSTAPPGKFDHCRRARPEFFEVSEIHTIWL